MHNLDTCHWVKVHNLDTCHWVTQIHALRRGLMGYHTLQPHHAQQCNSKDTVRDPHSLHTPTRMTPSVCATDTRHQNMHLLFEQYKGKTLHCVHRLHTDYQCLRSDTMTSHPNQGIPACSPRLLLAWPVPVPLPCQRLEPPYSRAGPTWGLNYWPPGRNEHLTRAIHEMGRTENGPISGQPHPQK